MGQCQGRPPHPPKEVELLWRKNWKDIPDHLKKNNVLEKLKIERENQKITLAGTSAFWSHKTLRILDLRGCQLETLPPQIHMLEALEWLDVEGNQLNTLPNEVGSLSKLQGVYVVRDNPLLFLPLEIVERGDEAVLAFLRSLWRDFPHVTYAPTTTPTSDPPVHEPTEAAISKVVKVLVVGDPSMGKTSLIQAVTSPTDVCEKPISVDTSTIGVDITVWKPVQSTKRVTALVWDFAGQQVYYASHRFFLSRRSVFVLPFSLNPSSDHLNTKIEDPIAEEESYLRHVESTLESWLLSIHSQVPDATVIIVGTHAGVSGGPEVVNERYERVAAYVKDVKTRLNSLVVGIAQNLYLEEQALRARMEGKRASKDGESKESRKPSLTDSLARYPSQISDMLTKSIAKTKLSAFFGWWVPSQVAASTQGRIPEGELRAKFIRSRLANLTVQGGKGYTPRAMKVVTGLKKGSQKEYADHCVDNFLGTGIDTIRKAIVTAMEDEDHIANPKELPARWVKLHDWIQSFANTDCPMVMLDEAIAWGESNKLPADELIQAVRFFNDLGAVVFFGGNAADEEVGKMKGGIFVDPSWLLEKVKVVIRHDYESQLEQVRQDLLNSAGEYTKKGLSFKTIKPWMDELQSKGLLREKLLTEVLWNGVDPKLHQPLLTLLEECSVVVRCSVTLPEGIDFVEEAHPSDPMLIKGLHSTPPTREEDEEVVHGGSTYFIPSLVHDKWVFDEELDERMDNFSRKRYFRVATDTFPNGFFAAVSGSVVGMVEYSLNLRIVSIARDKIAFVSDDRRVCVALSLVRIQLGAASGSTVEGANTTYCEELVVEQLGFSAADIIDPEGGGQPLSSGPMADDMMILEHLYRMILSHAAWHIGANFHFLYPCLCKQCRLRINSAPLVEVHKRSDHLLPFHVKRESSTHATVKCRVSKVLLDAEEVDLFGPIAPKVFLSYCQSSESLLCDFVQDQIEKRLFWKCWRDGEVLQAGDKLHKSMFDGITNCHAMVSFLSAPYAKSYNCMKELEKSMEQDKTLVLFLDKTLRPNKHEQWKAAEVPESQFPLLDEVFTTNIFFQFQKSYRVDKDAVGGTSLVLGAGFQAEFERFIKVVKKKVKAAVRAEEDAEEDVAATPSLEGVVLVESGINHSCGESGGTLGGVGQPGEDLLDYSGEQQSEFNSTASTWKGDDTRRLSGSNVSVKQQHKPSKSGNTDESLGVSTSDNPNGDAVAEALAEKG